MVLSEINNQFSNGLIDNLVTSFYTMGRPDDVSAFLLRACEVLQSLPADRLEAEKKILSTEAASRSYDVVGNLMLQRFGAAGHGLRGTPEFGTRGATLEQLDEWRLQRFTRGNAVLWLSGPLPPDLCLDLPPGEKLPLPPLTPKRTAFPSWFVDNMCNGIAAGAIVPRVAAASIFSQIASIRLFDWLRIKQAVSYATWVSYEPLNADIAHLVLYADSHQDRRAELAEAFGEIFEKLTEFDDREVDTAVKQIIETRTGSLAPPLSDRIVMEAHRAAMDWLFGREFEAIELLAAQDATIRAADVATFSCEMQQSSIFALPGKAIIRPWMGKQAPVSIGPVVEGQEILSIDAPVQRVRLVYGPEGVSMRWPDDSHVTVRYSELAAALHYEDGCISLLGSDGTWMNIEPTLWRNGPSICRKIFERIPVHLLLEQGTRSADEIPQPKTTAWQRLRASLSQSR